MLGAKFDKWMRDGIALDLLSVGARSFTPYVGRGRVDAGICAHQVITTGLHRAGAQCQKARRKCANHRNDISRQPDGAVGIGDDATGARGNGILLDIGATRAWTRGVSVD